MLSRGLALETDLYEAIRVRDLLRPGFHYYQIVLYPQMEYRIEILKPCQEIILFCASWNVQPESLGGISQTNCTEASQ